MYRPSASAFTPASFARSLHVTPAHRSAAACASSRAFAAPCQTVLVALAAMPASSASPPTIAPVAPITPAVPARLLRARFIHLQRASLHGHSVELGDGFCRVLIRT